GFAIYDSTQWAKAKKQLPTQVPPVLKLQRYHWLYWDHKEARSLEKLAKKFGISPQGLRQTVDAYNDAIKNDKPDPANKMSDTRSPILKPSFYGIDISIKLTKGLQQVIGLSLGGLRVEEESGLVLNEAGKPIKGLYAAGRNAVGICSSTYHAMVEEPINNSQCLGSACSKVASSKFVDQSRYSAANDRYSPMPSTA
ncbi:hypothetical protein BHE90_012282, partial [Fusarium euwallaceae]